MPRLLTIRDLRAIAFIVSLAAGCSVTPPTTTSTPTPTASPEVLTGELRFADAADRQVPADGTSSTQIVATLTDSAGQPVVGRAVELRRAGPAAPPLTLAATTSATGTSDFTVTANDAGSASFGLFAGTESVPLASIDVDFTRKVVVLAPGFRSALVRRFAIFGQPSECVDSAKPGSITEALICLGYMQNAADDPAIGVPTPGATILDMSWEPALCRESDPDGALHCVATIKRSADGMDLLWQPADYDLATLAVSLARQSSVDAWAVRLLRTLITYDEELHSATGTHASFYLVGHSLGGEVVVRSLRALLDEPDLAGAFEGDNRGRLQLVLSVDGALNWTGGFGFFGSGERCGVPVYTTADAEREVDNVDAVEQAFDRFGTQTVAATSETDPVVGPDVALLNSPERPDRGYFESLFASTADCAHSSLLRPEPVAPVTFPLNELLIEHVGPAAGG
jgi:hypothetical protein